MSRRVKKPLAKRSPGGERGRADRSKTGAKTASGKSFGGKSARPASDRPAGDRPSFGKSGRVSSDRPMSARPPRGRSERPEHSEWGDRPERAARPERSERPQRSERPAGDRPGARGGKPTPRYGNAPLREPRVSKRPPFDPETFVPEEPKPEVPAEPLPTAVQSVLVTPDENGMRVDRFLEGRFPGLSFSHIQRIVRKGELRVNGKRADSKDRLEEGQTVRIPPLKLDAPKGGGELSEAATKTLQALKDMTIYEDDDVMVLNKPAGLAVQGGSGTTRHVDMMLEVMRDAKGQKPRLVHRLDKETSGCLLIAKTRFAATKLTGAFRERSARKMYWALVAGVPKPKQGRISTYLAKEESEDDTIMRVA
ncbi:MAG: pseudouridine synthase, partial [Tardiphaga sp.]